MLTVNKTNTSVDCLVMVERSQDIFLPPFKDVHISKICVVKCKYPVNPQSQFTQRKAQEAKQKGFNGVLFIHVGKTGHLSQQQLLVLFSSVATITKKVTRWKEYDNISKGFGKLQLVVNGTVVAEKETDDVLAEVEHQWLEEFTVKEDRLNDVRYIKLLQKHKTPIAIREATIAELILSKQRTGWLYKLKISEFGDISMLQQYVDIEAEIAKTEVELQEANRQLRQEFKEKFGVDYDQAPETLRKIALKLDSYKITGEDVINLIAEIETWKPDLDALVDENIDEDEYLDAAGLGRWTCGDDETWIVTRKLSNDEKRKLIIWALINDVDIVVRNNNRCVIWQ